MVQLQLYIDSSSAGISARITHSGLFQNLRSVHRCRQGNTIIFPLPCEFLAETPVTTVTTTTKQMNQRKPSQLLIHAAYRGAPKPKLTQSGGLEFQIIEYFQQRTIYLQRNDKTEQFQSSNLREGKYLEKEMATHPSTLAWKIPWTEELVGYSPWGHKESDMTERLYFCFIFNLNFSLILFLPVIGEGNGNPLQYSCLENPMEEEPGRLQSMGSQRVGHD